MANSSGKPWSSSSNAPQIPLQVYLAEKGHFAGLVISAISFGIVIILFFQCMSALLNPACRARGGVKWVLFAHTVAMFSFLAIPFAIDLNDEFMGYINNRDFPVGPYGYSGSFDVKAITVAYSAMFPLNQWLADGLLLYRCYVIYTMNHWAVVFPCLVYLASVVTGIARIYETSKLNAQRVAWINFNTSFLSISLSLNILLTLMIAARLVMHSRNVRKAVGASDSAIGSYTTIVTMLVESCSIYALALLLYTVPWAISHWSTLIFAKILATIQVIAPYLITLRVANHKALTGAMVGTGSERIDSIQFRSQGTVDDDASFADVDPTSSVELSAGSETPNESETGVRVEKVIEEAAL